MKEGSLNCIRMACLFCMKNCVMLNIIILIKYIARTGFNNTMVIYAFTTDSSFLKITAPKTNRLPAVLFFEIFNTTAID
jgi:hypothetical protein